MSNRLGLPSIPWDALVDNPKNATLGYSVFNPTNPDLRHGKDFVSQRLVGGISRRAFKSSAITNLKDFT